MFKFTTSMAIAIAAIFSVIDAAAIPDQPAPAGARKASYSRNIAITKTLCLYKLLSI